MLNRRNFLKSGLTAGVAPLTTGFSDLDTLAASAEEVTSTGLLVELPQRLPANDSANPPWQQKIRRVGQTNFTEYDPAVMNVDQWADYWHSVKADIVYVSV
ncbi:MAG TPA: twin-arginine translocation signal domain-containing protein, partial [Acidobacteriaceae bacterium]|nr:twin-arginine translocation signal domain-containing protein [Acidobacteriaceae bacterium]